MSDQYYTVEEVAGMLKIHPKTIQRYIREGKLKAGKVGKAWRISGNDLSSFTENSGITVAEAIDASEVAENKEIKVSAVVDIPVKSTEESIRISNTLTAALNSKPSEYGASSLRTQYLMPENIVRVMLWGSLDFTKIMLDYISDLTE